MHRESKYRIGGSVFLSQPVGELLIDRLTMAHRHEADGAGLTVDGIDDPKTSNAILPQPVEFSQERFATFGVGGNGTNC